MQSSITAVPPASAGEGLPDIVVDFLNRLRRLPVGAWAEAALRAGGRARGVDVPPRPGSVDAAHSRLRRIAAGAPALAALTQHRVQDLVEIAQGCIGDDDATAMRHVALAAALALAMREELGEDCFAALYAPFASIVPLRARTTSEPYVTTSAA